MSLGSVLQSTHAFVAIIAQEIVDARYLESSYPSELQIICRYYRFLIHTSQRFSHTRIATIRTVHRVRHHSNGHTQPRFRTHRQAALAPKVAACLTQPTGGWVSPETLSTEQRVLSRSKRGPRSKSAPSCSSSLAQFISKLRSPYLGTAYKFEVVAQIRTGILWFALPASSFSKAHRDRETTIIYGVVAMTKLKIRGQPYKEWVPRKGKGTEWLWEPKAQPVWPMALGGGLGGIAQVMPWHNHPQYQCAKCGNSFPQHSVMYGMNKYPAGHKWAGLGSGGLCHKCADGPVDAATGKNQ